MFLVCLAGAKTTVCFPHVFMQCIQPHGMGSLALDDFLRSLALDDFLKASLRVCRTCIFGK